MSIRNGDTVVVHYVGTLNDGTEFDRSPADSPLVFQVGGGQMIPGFEQAVLNHEKGDRPPKPTAFVTRSCCSRCRAPRCRPTSCPNPVCCCT